MVTNDECDLSDVITYYGICDHAAVAILSRHSKFRLRLGDIAIANRHRAPE